MPNWSAYKAKEREARKEAGFKRVEVWAHKDDAEKVKNFAAALEAMQMMRTTVKKRS